MLQLYEGILIPAPQIENRSRAIPTAPVERAIFMVGVGDLRVNLYG